MYVRSYLFEHATHHTRVARNLVDLRAIVGELDVSFENSRVFGFFTRIDAIEDRTHRTRC
jgi:hypothetical protein